MFAVVKTGGKQYRVEQGQYLLVERLAVDEGKKVELEPLLISGDDPVVDSAGLSKAKVEAKILEHVRGPKVRGLKFKPKRGYKRRYGHRQELTKIEITSIKAAGAAAAKKPAAEQVEADKPAAEAKPKAAPQTR